MQEFSDRKYQALEARVGITVPRTVLWRPKDNGTHLIVEGDDRDEMRAAFLGIISMFHNRDDVELILIPEESGDAERTRIAERLNKLFDERAPLFEGSGSWDYRFHRKVTQQINQRLRPVIVAVPSYDQLPVGSALYEAIERIWRFLDQISIHIVVEHPCEPIIRPRESARLQLQFSSPGQAIFTDSSGERDLVHYEAGHLFH